MLGNIAASATMSHDVNNVFTMLIEAPYNTNMTFADDKSTIISENTYTNRGTF